MPENTEPAMVFHIIHIIHTLAEAPKTLAFSAKSQLILHPYVL